MAIPQSIIRSALDSEAQDLLIDSDGHDALELLQVVDAAKTFYSNRLLYQNFAYVNYYDSSSALPSYIDDSDGYLVVSDSSLEGLMVVTSNLTENDNSLWLHTGDRWRELINLDSAIVNNTQGQIYAYSFGGNNFPGSLTNDIDRWPFASEGTATKVGTLSTLKSYSTATSSKTHGYSVGGDPVASPTNYIEKISFSNDTQGYGVAELIEKKSKGSGQNSEFFGYQTSGEPRPVPTSPSYEKPFIQKYSFINDEKASFVNYLKTESNFPAGISSKTEGYSAAGSSLPSQTVLSAINKFVFSKDDKEIVELSNLTAARDGATGISSLYNGWLSSGRKYLGPSPSLINIIEQFPFANDNLVSDIGDQFIGKAWSAGHSYDDQYGYTSGGTNLGQAALIIIDKFPFTAPFTTSTQVGDMSSAKVGVAGTQF